MDVLIPAAKDVRERIAIVQAELKVLKKLLKLAVQNEAVQPEVRSDVSCDQTSL